MTAHRPTRRAGRVALAATGLTLAAAAVAPGAFAASNSSTTVPDYAGGVVIQPPSSGGTVLPPAGSVVPPAATTPKPVKHVSQSVSASHVSSASTLAYTGAEVGGAAAIGLVLVAGGALMVRGGRRRGSLA